MKDYVNPQGIKTPIVICSCTARLWLNKLGYVYKKIQKDIFVDKHKWLNVIENCQKFLKKIEDFKPYIVEFEENDIIKPKVYFQDYIIEDNERQPIIGIIYDKYTFSSNNRIQKA